MSSTDIYTLINNYKQTVATETDASLHACEVLHQIQSVLLEQNGNANASKYKKAISELRKELDISRPQMMKDIAVGRALTMVNARDNQIRCMTKSAIYKQYCAPPTKPKQSKEKIDWKQKHDYMQEQLGFFIQKYETLKEKYERLASALD